MAEDTYQPTPSKPSTFMDSRWLTHVVKIPDADLRAHSVALTYSKLGLVLDNLVCGRDPDAERDLGKAEPDKADGDKTDGDKTEPDKTEPDKTEPDKSNANWFQFATWGTVTLSVNIANQRPPQRIDMLPLLSLRRRLTPLVVQLRASSGQRVSQALAWGQRLMFVSVGFTLLELADWLADDPAADPATFSLVGDKSQLRGPNAKAIDELGTWRGRKWIRPNRHLRVVSEAFRFYIRARQAEDRMDRARCILGANVLLTSIEQDLVDPAIEAVVNHIPQTMAAAADQRLARWVERWTSVPSQLTSLQLPFRYTSARQFLDAAWSRLMTDQVFVIALPTETLRLGRDIPPLSPDQPYFPRDLRSLRPSAGTATAAAAPTGPMTDALADVAEVIESLDRTSGNGLGSAARDWRRWDERMNFAVTLMRSRQQDDTLFWSPYSHEDQRRIVVGELPHRTGDPSVLEVQAPLSNQAFLDALEATQAGRGGFP